METQLIAPTDILGAPLSDEQIQFYRQHGYLHLPGIFDEAWVGAMRGSLDKTVEDWAQVGSGWKSNTGKYDNSKDSQVIVVQRLEHFGHIWNSAKHNPDLVAAATSLLGSDVEYFGSSTHSKPAKSGGAFPMHQDSFFYDHSDDRLLICMVHLDDTHEGNGPISFLDPLPEAHIPHTKETDPENGGSYLDPAKYDIDAATPVFCKAGDVVIFNQYTIHGSKPNTSDQDRRAVVFRYRHPDNLPTHKGGHQPLDPNEAVLGTMVAGSRPAREGFCAAPGGDVTRLARREWFANK